MVTKMMALVEIFLATENILERRSISHMVFEILESVKHSKKLEFLLQEEFIRNMKICAINPDSIHRLAIFEVIKDYKKNNKLQVVA